MKLFNNYDCLDLEAEVSERLSGEEQRLIEEVNSFSCFYSDEITDTTIIDNIDTIEEFINDMPDVLNFNALKFNLFILSLMKQIQTQNYAELVASVIYIKSNDLLNEWGTLNRSEELENMLADNAYCREKGLSPTYRLDDLDGLDDLDD